MFENYKVMSFKTAAEQLNDITFTDFYNRLSLMARAVFEWKGLPKGIEEKHIEKYLFSEGKCMFFKDDQLGYMVTRCNETGVYNANEEPTILKPVVHGDYIPTEKENNIDAVLIQNNDERIPTSPTIHLFAHRLTELSRTIDINVNAQKTPVLMLGTEKQKQALKLVYKKWNGNEPVIYGDKKFNETLSKMQTLDTKAPIVFDKLQIQKHSVWNECMTFLGINNANMDKRERLVDDEVEANNEQIELSFQVMFKSRQNACKLINQMFPDLKVSVCIRDLKSEDISELEGNDKKTPEESVPMEEGAA